MSVTIEWVENERSLFFGPGPVLVLAKESWSRANGGGTAMNRPVNNGHDTAG